MTITYDPNHAAYHDEADVRGEMTRVFDVCDGCRRCVHLCTSFPSLFEMLGASGGNDAGALTPAQQDRVVDECFQCRLCRANCPYVPGLHELAIDFPRLMARARAMRHSTGQRTISAIVADQLLGRTDLVGRWATRTAAASNRVVGVEPGTIRRRVLARLTGVSARRRWTPYARRRFSSTIGRRTTGDPAAERRVTVFPTCFVEYRRPQIGTALVDVYAQNGIACEVARVGCCGAPWLTAGDTRRFAAQASRNVVTLAAAIRAGTDVVVAQPTCHAVITTDYIDHVGGSDAELVAGRTFDALSYLADHVSRADHLIGQPADGSPGRTGRRTLAGTVDADGMGFEASTRIVYHEPCPGLGDESPSPARRLLEMTGPTVDDVRRSTGVDARWGLRVANESISLAMAGELGAAIEQSDAEVVCGSCVLTNSSIAEQTGREVIHPFELLAEPSDVAPRRGRRRGDMGDPE
jgi:Fe-S oxidoreductase